MPGPTEAQRAYSISEKLLEMTRHALLNDDFATFEKSFLLPHVHTTLEGTTVLETIEDLRFLFDRVTAEFRRRNVDDIHRVLVSARFVTPFLIEARSISHHLSGGTRVNTPFPVQSELVQCGREWRIASANYGVGSCDSRVADALMPEHFPSEKSPYPHDDSQDNTRRPDRSG